MQAIGAALPLSFAGAAAIAVVVDSSVRQAIRIEVVKAARRGKLERRDYFLALEPKPFPAVQFFTFCIHREEVPPHHRLSAGVALRVGHTGGPPHKHWLLERLGLSPYLQTVLDSATVSVRAPVQNGHVTFGHNFPVRYLQNAMTSSEEEHVSRKQRATASRGH